MDKGKGGEGVLRSHAEPMADTLWGLGSEATKGSAVQRDNMLVSYLNVVLRWLRKIIYKNH